MAFAVEKIPSDKEFDIAVFHRPFSSNPFQPIGRNGSWAVDNERHAFLVRLGGGGPWEGPGMPQPKQYFALSWQNNVVKFATNERNRRNAGGTEITAIWTVSEIQIPKPLARQRREVIRLVADSLMAIGDHVFRRRDYVAVEVIFK